MNERDYTAAERSLRRRLQFAEALQVRVDRLFSHGRKMRIRWRRRTYALGNLAFDIGESVRSARLVPFLGRVNLAVAEAEARPGLPQYPPRRSYWYDHRRHALVGMSLGIDLIRHGERYHLVESNLGAAMRPARRALYAKEGIDPLVSGLARAVKDMNFRRLVPLAPMWTRALLAEWAKVSEATNLEVVPGCVWPIKGAPGQAMPALPVPLQEETAYVFFHSTTPVARMMHDKMQVGKWLTEAVEAADAPPRRLAVIPSYDRLALPETSPGPPWPNLVVKLATSDQGRHVAMGRFDDEAAAKAGLRLTSDMIPPGIFRFSPVLRLRHGLFRRRRVIYQPFIPPEVVDGRARQIRMHVFISPHLDRFLSAHAVLAAVDLPRDSARGLVGTPNPFMINFSEGGRYAGISEVEEEELAEVAEDFGRLARWAISRRFEIG